MHEEAYQFGFQDEIEKIAKGRPGVLMSKLRKLLTGQEWRGGRFTGRWVRPLSPKAYQARHGVKAVPKKPFTPLGYPGEMTPARAAKWGRAMEAADIRTQRFYKAELPPFLAAGVKGSYTYRL